MAALNSNRASEDSSKYPCPQILSAEQLWQWLPGGYSSRIQRTAVVQEV